MIHFECDVAFAGTEDFFKTNFESKFTGHKSEKEKEKQDRNFGNLFTKHGEASGALKMDCRAKYDSKETPLADDK